MIKSEVEYLNKMTEQARARLILEFDQWYKAVYDDDGMGGGEAADNQENPDGEVRAPEPPLLLPPPSRVRLFATSGAPRSRDREEERAHAPVEDGASFSVVAAP
eukprot:2338028-Rhodomonas_salina.2